MTWRDKYFFCFNSLYKANLSLFQMWTSAPSATIPVTTMLFVITLSGHITVRVTLNTLQTAPRAQVNSCLIHLLKIYILLSSQCPFCVAPNSTVCPFNFICPFVCLSVYLFIQPCDMVWALSSHIWNYIWSGPRYKIQRGKTLKPSLNAIFS